MEDLIHVPVSCGQMSYSVRCTQCVTQRIKGKEASGFWPIDDDEEIEKEHGSCDLLFFEPNVMYLQFIKSKPQRSPRRSVCLILFVQIGKWRLGEIK